jgi:ferredoxin
MGVDPGRLPVQEQARVRGLGVLEESELDVRGPFEVIPDFKMPITFAGKIEQEGTTQVKNLYAGNMMADRVSSKPVYHEERCIKCGDCVENCPAEALTLEPEFNISDKCIVCFCCVELCPEGALEVPDIEAFRHY